MLASCPPNFNFLSISTQKKQSGSDLKIVSGGASSADVSIASTSVKKKTKSSKKVASVRSAGGPSLGKLPRRRLAAA